MIRTLQVSLRVLPVIASLSCGALLSCGAEITKTGFTERGTIFDGSREELATAIKSSDAVSRLQQYLFDLGVSGPTSLTGADCSDGGSSTTTYEVDEAPVGTLSSGDRVRITFDGCAEGDTTYQGSIFFEFDLVVGDPSSDDVWNLSATLSAEDFVKASADRQAVSNGELRLQVDYQEGDIVIEMTGDLSRAISDEQGTRTRSIERLDFTWTYTAASGTASVVVGGRFRSDALTGEFELKTVEPLVGAPFEVPDAGEIRLEGADDASLSILIAEGHVVRLRLDSDGDGIIDDVQSTTWDEL